MQESFLLKIALVTSLTGLVLLFVFADSIIVSDSTISKIDRTDQGNFVKIQGTLKAISNRNGITILQVEQPEVISVVLFSNSSFTEGQRVEILGKVSEYSGKEQIIADKMRVIS